MVSSREAQKSTASPGIAGGLATALADLLRTVKALFDPYRPELHYMRGPGPKWRAKHAPAPAPVTADVHAQHALVRVQAR